VVVLCVSEWVWVTHTYASAVAPTVTTAAVGAVTNTHTHTHTHIHTHTIQVLLLRLSPLLPFALSNYLYGMTKVNLLEYLAGTAIGFAPGIHISHTYTYVCMYIYIYNMYVFVYSKCTQCSGMRCVKVCDGAKMHSV
jgi:hypothetical protein